jgi:hypothetical protein
MVGDLDEFIVAERGFTERASASLGRSSCIEGSNPSPPHKLFQTVLASPQTLRVKNTPV